MERYNKGSGSKSENSIKFLGNSQLQDSYEWL